MTSVEGIVSGRKLGREKTNTRPSASSSSSEANLPLSLNFHPNTSQFHPITSKFLLTTDNYKKQNTVILHNLLNGAVHFWQQKQTFLILLPQDRRCLLSHV